MNESKLNEVGKMSLIMPSATGKSASFLFTFGFTKLEKGNATVQGRCSVLRLRTVAQFLSEKGRVFRIAQF
jgi:hypothetical protein